MSARSDFLPRLQADAPLLAVKQQIDIAPLSPEGLSEVVKRPAAALDVRFEPGVDDALIEATREQAGALPLLSDTLDVLWKEMQERGDGVLRWSRPLKDGVDVALKLGERADGFVKAHQQQEALIRRLFCVRLAYVPQQGAATRRTAFLEELTEPERTLIAELAGADQRIVVTGEREGKAAAEVAHEALFTAWPSLRNWIAARRAFYAWVTQVEADRQDWEKQGKPNSALLTGRPLQRARNFLETDGEDVPAADREFIKRSRRHQLLGLMVLPSAVVAIPAIAGIVWAATVWWGVRAVEAKMNFVQVPMGCFEMGRNDTEDHGNSPEGPKHRVCLKGFDLGQYTVTQNEWRRVMAFLNPDPSNFKGDNHPVEMVSWNNVQWFIRLMSFFGRGRYRLPSEAEWEYAARANTTTTNFWGERVEDGCAYANIADLSLKKALPRAVVVANCDDGYAWTAPVGRFKPNPFGLYDMLGNVAQWVEDCFLEKYDKTPIDGTAYTSGPCDQRVVRGASIISQPQGVRSANRDADAPNFLNPYIGFRLVRTTAP